MIVASICAALVLWGAAAFRWAKFRKTAGQRALTYSIVALAISATLFVPSVSSWIDTRTGFPQLASALLFASGAFAALALVSALRFMEMTDRQARSGALLRRTLVGLAVIGVGTALVIGQPTASVSASWADEAAMISFWTLWVGFVVVACGWILVRIVRRFRQMAPSRVRASLGVLGGAAAFGLLYGVTKGVLVSASLRDVALPGVSLVSQACAIAMLVTLGFASVIAALPAVKRAQASRDARSAELIRPLWEALREIDPAVELPSEKPELALYRMVVECRDWMRQLRFSLPEDAWPRAVEAAATNSKLTDSDVKVLATAGWIRAGMAAHLRGSSASDVSPRSTAPPTMADIDSEIDFLQRVAQVSVHDAQAVAERVTNPPDLRSSERSRSSKQ